MAELEDLFAVPASSSTPQPIIISNPALSRTLAWFFMSSPVMQVWEG
jgi:hypothetical protein